MLYGHNQYKEKCDTTDLGMFGGHCFYIKNVGVLCEKRKYLACKQIFTQASHMDCYSTDGLCNVGKTKLIYNGKKFNTYKAGRFEGSFFWRRGVKLSPLHISSRTNPISI